jgi:hypothetical protein
LVSISVRTHSTWSAVLDGWLCREEPLGVTAELGYSLPTQSSTTEIEDGAIVKVHNPQFLIWGGSGSIQHALS